MRIVQILPVLAFGDAVGNDTRALKDALLEAGYETEIYAAVIDERRRERQSRLICWRSWRMMIS